mgnify:CR=1 FL=1
MSDMALTVSQEGRNSVQGSRITATFKITPDTSWLAAGEELKLSELCSIPIMETITLDGGGTGYVWQYDRDSELLLAFEAGADGAALDAVGDGTNLSTHTIYLTVVGRRA